MNLPHRALRILATVTVLFLALGSLLFLSAYLLPTGCSGNVNRDRPSFEKNAVARLRVALSNFRGEYGHYPLVGDQDDATILSDKRLMGVLLAKDRNANLKGIVFLEAKPARKERGGLVSDGPKAGFYVDSWGNPYHLVFDTDNDNRVTEPHTGEILFHKRVIVYSAGPDGDPATTGDNIATWR